MTHVSSPVHLASPAVTPASPQHLAQIASARQQFRKIARAAGTAAMSGWSIAIFGAITLLTGFMSFNGVMLGLGMCVVGYYELNSAKQIRRLNPDVLKRMAINQLIFGALLTIYACYAMWISLRQPSDIDNALSDTPQAAQILGSIGNLEHTITISIYLAIIVAAIIGCGGMAWYYVTRRKYIVNYLQQAPPWIIELQKAGMSV